MQLRLGKSFQQKIRGRFGKYRFEVGVLEDGPHKLAKEAGPDGRKQLGSYAGGPVRKKSSQDGPLTIAQVSAANRERLGINYLTEPFQNRSADIIKFTDAFFKLVFGRSQKKRAENLLQAIVRNPILRGEYGGNSRSTRRHKGFDRNMIDTAQLFKSIKAVCKVRGG